MATGRFSLTSDACSTDREGWTGLRWPVSAGATETVRADLGWWLQELGRVPDAAIDLARIAGGAYLADRLTTRGAGFTREMHLDVAVTDPDRWTGSVADDTADLLRWLTGDQWTLTLVPDSTDEKPQQLPVPEDGTPVSLLSGGLDSYLGALHLLNQPDPVRFLGHVDTSTAVQSAQNRVRGWMQRSYSPAPSYTRLRLTQAQGKGERSSRSRSLMFLALGTAATSSRDGTRVVVPENGYTSLNIPLHPNRAGALSTRSTHPETFARVERLLSKIGLPVTVSNPFEAMTKGEAMREVASRALPSGWEDVAASTISCSKLDGGRLRGGNPNLNCGLCLSCLVRRGTFIAADVPDRTPYLVHELSGASRDDLIRRRREDIDAVRYATASGVDEDTLDAGTWPDGYDLDAASQLIQRGLRELAAVPQP